MGAKPAAGKGLRIASGCSTLDEFTAVFRKFCTPNSIFIATRIPRPAGIDIRFAITLKDGKPVMSGAGRIRESYETNDNRYERSGMVVEFSKLDTMGRILLRELNARPKPSATTPNPAPPGQATPAPAGKGKGKSENFEIPTLVGGPDEETLAASRKSDTMAAPKAPDEAGEDDDASAAPDAGDAAASAQPKDEPAGEEQEPEPKRAKGSSIVLPANPFGELAPQSLEAFIECTLYEETGELDLSDYEAPESSSEATAGNSSDSGENRSEAEEEPKADEDALIAASDEQVDAAVATLTPEGEDAAEAKGEDAAEAKDTAPAAPKPPKIPAVPARPRIPEIRKIPEIRAVKTPPIPERGKASEAASAEKAATASEAPSAAEDEAVVLVSRDGSGAAKPATPDAPPRPAPIAASGTVSPARSPDAGAAPQAAPIEEPVYAPPATQIATYPAPPEASANSAGAIPTPAPTPTPAPVPVLGNVAPQPPPPQPLYSPPDHTPVPGSFPTNYSEATDITRLGTLEPKKRTITITLPQALGLVGLCIIAGLGFGLLAKSDSKKKVAENASTGAEVAQKNTETSQAEAALAPTEPKVTVPEEARPGDESADEVAADAPAVASDAGAPDDEPEAVAAVDLATSEATPAAATTTTPPEPSEPAVPTESLGTCSLVIDSVPKDAMIRVGDTAVRRGAKQAQVPCGDVTVVATHPRYVNHESSMALVADEANTLRLRMKRPIISLRVLSSPAGATVTFNKRKVGKAPLRRNIPAFENVRVSVSKPGYQTFSRKVYPKKNSTMNVKLKKASSRPRRSPTSRRRR